MKRAVEPMKPHQTYILHTDFLFKKSLKIQIKLADH